MTDQGSALTGAADADPKARCKDYPDVSVADAVALEVRLRELLDEDEAVDAAVLVLAAGWRPSPGALPPSVSVSEEHA